MSAHRYHLHIVNSSTPKHRLGYIEYVMECSIRSDGVPKELAMGYVPRYKVGYGAFRSGKETEMSNTKTQHTPKYTRYLVTAVYADVTVYERHSMFSPSIERVTEQLREVYCDADSLTVERM